MDEPQKNIVSIREAAAYLGISVDTLRRWHNSGKFKATFVSQGGHRYYSLADLEKMMKGITRIAWEWVSVEQPQLPEEAFYCSTSDRFKTRHERMAHELDKDSSLQNIASLISSAAGEIGNNSFDHNLGNWPDVRGTFFAYDLSKRVVVLADRGVGVLTTLRQIRPDLKIDADALRVAFTEIVTGRAPEHRGNGLKYVKEAIILSGAEISFQSGNAVFEIKKGESEFTIKEVDTPIRGSISIIRY